MSKENRAKGSAVVCTTHERRTCIEVARGVSVKYIPLDVEHGLRVRESAAHTFDQQFRPMENYPVDQACTLYLGYAQSIGASKEALQYMSQIITITEKEFSMAEQKFTDRAEGIEPPTKAVKSAKSAKKPKTPKAAPIPKAPKVEAIPKAAKAPKAAAEPGPKKVTAAQMFQELILSGDWTDNEIFEKVQSEFGLDEKKRGYVQWYRNHLKKSGKNPPEAKK